MTTILPNVIWPPATGPAARQDINTVADASTTNESGAQIAAENAPIPVAYGRVEVVGQPAMVRVHQGKLVLMFVWSEGEIDGVESYTINNEAAPAGTVATHYTGTATQGVDPTLAAAISGYADTLPGIAYSVIQIPPAVNGWPSVRAIVRGKKLYDPRTESTVFSTCPALMLADFLASTRYGWGRAVDWTSVGPTANANNELVGGLSRRSCGLLLGGSQACRQWAEALRTYAGCWIVQGSAGVRLIPDRPA